MTEPPPKPKHRRARSVTEAAAERHERERPAYERLCARVVALLEHELAAQGVLCRVHGRVKTSQSLLRKMLVKQRGYAEVRDKAGVRIVLNYPGDRKQAAAVVRGCLKVHALEDKADALLADRIGYRALHLDTQIEQDEFADMFCEVQIHKPGEALWAGLAHDLIYKSAVELPVAVKRKLNRLIVLAEIIDDEAMDVRAAVIEISTRPAMRALAEAKALLGPGMPHSSLSVVILEQLAAAGLLDDDPAAALRAFYDKEKSRVEAILEERESSWDPVFKEPAVLALFMLLDGAAGQLAQSPPAVLTPPILADVATAWGVVWSELGRPG